MSKEKPFTSALSVSEGVEQPPVTNPGAALRLKKLKKKKLNTEEYIQGIKDGNPVILGQAITLIESNNPKHNAKSQKIIEACIPLSGKSIRVGVTGVPGVGKSTFIESFGTEITNKGHKLAVLAIDPSSDRTKGSILGDKTRMESLAANKNAFIRPSPSSGSLGGVARKTRETVILCEAAGFDVILIETVGVGQSETAVHSMVDFFLLLMLAGAGDELQGIKRGIMEMADMIAISKADGANVNKATQAKAEYANALHLFPPTESGWMPQVLTCSSLLNEGIATIWQKILEYKNRMTVSGYIQERRKSQALYWMEESIEDQLRSGFYRNPQVEKDIEEIRQKVIQDKVSSFVAANKLIKIYYDSIKG